MILVDRLSQNKSNSFKDTKLYINTLTPLFEFKNKAGRKVMPIKRCIRL